MNSFIRILERKINQQTRIIPSLEHTINCIRNRVNIWKIFITKKSVSIVFYGRCAKSYTIIHVKNDGSVFFVDFEKNRHLLDSKVNFDTFKDIADSLLFYSKETTYHYNEYQKNLQATQELFERQI